jgi:hypothetical protein
MGKELPENTCGTSIDVSSEGPLSGSISSSYICNERLCIPKEHMYILINRLMDLPSWRIRNN